MKKGKLLIPFAVLSLTCGLTAGILTGCKDDKPDGPHTHSFTTWDYDESSHWHVCEVDGATDEHVLHDFDDEGKCECGYQVFLETVSGKVIVAQGDTLSGVTVTLKNAAGSAIAVTDYTYNAETGEFSFKAPVKESGATEYTLVVSKDGYLEASNVIEISKGEAVTGLNISLTLVVQVAVEGQWQLSNVGVNGSMTSLGGYSRTMSARSYAGEQLYVEQKLQLPQSVIDAGPTEGDQYASRQGVTVLFENGSDKANWSSGDFTLMTREADGKPYTQIDVTDFVSNGCGKSAFGWGSVQQSKHLSDEQQEKYISEGIVLGIVYTKDNGGTFDFFIDGEYFGT